MMEEYIEKAKELGLIFYQPGPEQDLILFTWWTEMQQSGDIDRVFTAYHRTLSNFLDFLRPPCHLMFKLNESNEIIFAVWLVPVSDSDSSAFMGYWARETYRSTHEHARACYVVYNLAFKFWRVVVGVTKHESLLRIHRKLGYNIVGYIPYFLDGETVWVVYLTEENFKQSRVYQTGAKLWEAQA